MYRCSDTICCQTVVKLISAVISLQFHIQLCHELDFETQCLSPQTFEQKDINLFQVRVKVVNCNFARSFLFLTCQLR